MIDLSAFENDIDFQNFIHRYESPNLFSVMGKTHMEQWHSSFICWLLDPHANHGLGDHPLKLFFKLVSSKKNSITLEADISKMKFECEREIFVKKFGKGHIDVMGECSSAVLVIENKVKSGEHDNQTQKYSAYLDAELSGKQRCCVYLTSSKNAKQPQSKEFIMIYYHELFDRVILPCLHKDDIPDETALVLRQYAVAVSDPNNRDKNGKLVFDDIYYDREAANVIYSKHEHFFEQLGKALSAPGVDKGSDLFIFFKRYGRYINYILASSKQRPVILSSESTDYSMSFVYELIDNGYLTAAGKDEDLQEASQLLTYRGGAVYIIQFFEVDGSVCVIGGYTRAYKKVKQYIAADSDEGVTALSDGDDWTLFDSIHSASAAIQIATGSKSRNPGPNPSEYILFKPGKKRKGAEFKTLREIRKEL